MSLKSRILESDFLVQLVCLRGTHLGPSLGPSGASRFTCVVIHVLLSHNFVEALGCWAHLCLHPWGHSVPAGKQSLVFKIITYRVSEFILFPLRLRRESFGICLIPPMFEKGVHGVGSPGLVLVDTDPVKWSTQVSQYGVHGVGSPGPRLVRYQLHEKDQHLDIRGARGWLARP